MMKHWTPLAISWLVLAVAGLTLSAYFNVLSVMQARDFIGDWVGSGPAVSSLTVDLLIVALAGSILIVVEGRRAGMRHSWVFVPLSAITAFAFAFPLFLALRERHLAASRGEQQRRELDL